MSAVIDFRKGHWGHAMHGSTWTQEAPRVERVGLLRKKVEHPRVSVMVHVRSVNEGDEVLYTGTSGFDRIATVAEVQPCWNPRDMFTLILENIREYPAQASGEAA